MFPLPVLACLAPAAPASLTTCAYSDDELVEHCDAAARKHGLNGVVLLARGDEVLVERAYGLADVENAAPLRVDTPFLVASLTKPVVGYLTLRLVEEDVVRLHDKVSEHLTAFEEAPVGEATVHQLLRHTSGLPHYEGWPGFLESAGKEHSDRELLQRLATTPLRSPPGADFHYSGPGYLLLGKVLEQAAGEPLSVLLEEHVFVPLGMRSSRLLTVAGERPAHARPYVRVDGELVPARERHASTLHATGGLVTTARDLHRFLRAVRSGELLGPEGHATLLRASERYACGFIVYRHPVNQHRYARHKGSMDGVAAHFVLDLDDGRLAIALSNVDRAPVDVIDDQLLWRIPAPADAEAGK